jgi:hypothetical protein
VWGATGCDSGLYRVDWAFLEALILTVRRDGLASCGRCHADIDNLARDINVRRSCRSKSERRDLCIGIAASTKIESRSVAAATYRGWTKVLELDG